MISDREELLKCLGFESSPWLRRGETLTPVPATNSEAAPAADRVRASGPETASLCIIGPDLFAAAENELLARMLGAIGLRLPDLRIVDSSTLQGPLAEGSAQLYLLFSPVTASGLGLDPNACFETASPTECLRDAGLKRKIWDDLQQFARKAREFA